MKPARVLVAAVLLAIVVGSVLWLSAWPCPDGAPLPFDEASVYAAVLEFNARLGRLIPYSPADYRWRADARFLIHSQSFVPRLHLFTSESYRQSLLRVLPALSSRLWRDFLRRNGTSASIPRVLSSGVPFTLVTLHPGERLVSDSPLGRQYPGVVGIFIFSRVGFSASGQQALVHLAGSVAPDDHGSFILLRLAPKAWQVIAFQHAP